MKMLIYRSSILVGHVSHEVPKRAWAEARAIVRRLAHCDGVEGREVVAATAMRPFVQRGSYRAMPEMGARRRPISVGGGTP